MTTNDTTPKFLPGLALINRKAERRFRQAQQSIAKTGEKYNDGHWHRS